MEAAQEQEEGPRPPHRHLESVRSLLLVGILVVMLCGCTSAVTLRHPQTGQSAKCGPYYSLGGYYNAATLRERTCVQDFQRQGYERIPD